MSADKLPHVLTEESREAMRRGRVDDAQTYNWATVMLNQEAIFAKLNALHIPTWGCGCGHLNGSNLATCACCGRDPNGEWRGQPPV